MTHGAVMVLTTKALADWFPRDRRATVIGAKFFAMSGAGSVAGIAAPPLAMWLGWHRAFAILGVLVAVSGSVDGSIH